MYSRGYYFLFPGDYVILLLICCLSPLALAALVILLCSHCYESWQYSDARNEMRFKLWFAAVHKSYEEHKAGLISITAERMILAKQVSDLKARLDSGCSANPEADHAVYLILKDRDQRSEQLQSALRRQLRHTQGVLQINAALFGSWSLAAR